MRVAERVPGVAARIGLLRRRDAQMGAKARPSVAEFVDQQEPGRNRLADRFHVGFIGGDRASAENAPTIPLDRPDYSIWVIVARDIRVNA
jgi:hypothetical protein